MLELTLIGLLTAFIAGIASFLSPCVLPLVPGYLSYIAGGTAQPSTLQSGARAARWRALGLSACFVVGFSIVSLILGASITSFWRRFLASRYNLNMLAGTMIVVSGLMMTGLIRMPLTMQRYSRLVPRGGGAGPSSGTVLGLPFGFGWRPCLGSVLGGILVLS